MSTQNTSSNVTGTASESVNRLTTNQLYIGKVNSVDTNRGTLDVMVEQKLISNCLYAPGAIAGVLGASQISLPQPGSLVLFLYGGQNGNYVLGAAPASVSVSEVIRPVMTGVKDVDILQMKPLLYQAATEETLAAGTYPLPTDLFPGESEWSTGTGVVLRMLMNFAQMSAGDLAKIEVHLMNDMVRIMDNYFVHQTCGGEEQVWGAGRCTQERHFTPYVFEAEGKLTETEVLAEPGDTAMVYDLDKSVQDKPTSATGRWRFSEYVGFLGDMVHRFVTSPTEVISNVWEDSFRAGQYRSWVGSDGTFMLQAAGGVHVEVTQHIVIPAILKAWNDPDFDCAKAMEDLNGEFLQVWGSGPDWEDMKMACWQMNYYLKYITLWHSLARFRQMKEHGYCDIPTEKDAPERKPNANQEDVKSATGGLTDSPVKGHAALVMDPAGSISLLSNGNTSVIINQGSIQAYCPGNLELKAGGVVSIQGADVSIRGANRVEVVSLFGSLSLKARTLWQALCEAGRLWLKGDAKDDGSSAEDAAEALPEGMEVVDPEFSQYSVILDASQGKTLVHGAKGTVVGATGSEGHVHIQATGTDSDVRISASRYIAFQTYKDIIVRCLNWINNSTRMLCKAMYCKIGQAFAVSGGTTAVNNLQGRMGSFLTPPRSISDRLIKTKQEDLPDPSEIMDEGDPYEKVTEADWAAEDALPGRSLSTPYEQEEFSSDSMNWKLPDWSEVVGTSVQDYNSLKAAPGEQLGSEAKENYVEISWSSARLLNAPRTDSANAPFPGNEGRMFTFTKGTDRPLTKPWESDFTVNDICTIGDFTGQSYTMYIPKPGTDPNNTPGE